MDSVQFLKWISFFSLDRIIIYWNKLYDLRNLVGLPVCFYWTRYSKIKSSLFVHNKIVKFMVNLKANFIAIFSMVFFSTLYSRFANIITCKVRMHLLST